MLIANSLIDRIADMLSVDDFYEPVHARIFEAIVREASLGHSITPVGLKGYFEGDEALKELGGWAYLARLTGDPTALVAPIENARHLADISQRRSIRAGLSTAADACGDLDASIGDIIGHADAALNITGKEQIHQPTGGECFDELIAGFSEPRLGVECYQIPDLDKLLGPMRPKQLIIGAGRPGMGKTALALSYALGAARNGHGVLFVSLEMSSTELAARMAAALCFDTETKVPFSAIRDGTLSNHHMTKIHEARDYMRELPFQVVDAGQLTVGRLNTLIRRHARRMAARDQKLELVIVDYLQLLSPDQRSRSNYEAVSEVSRALKAMAKDHGVAVFALAQLSREVEKRPDKRPQLADLRDSGQIEQDADGVLFLLRKEYYVRKEQPPETSPEYPGWEAALQTVAGQIEFIVAKRRNGVEGAAMGRFHGAYQAVR
jgi:replicative DNA helicase